MRVLSLLNPAPAPALADDPLWYKDAVIYELRVRSFSDSNGDGIGDFPGLTQKIHYLRDLGVDALWLLPFYPSPGRDDGYDISDYTDINADYGRMEDFKDFLEAAHSRGMRVIIELVINHSSDQHPWFQRARRAPPGSSERDFYVWSDSPNRYRDARIIFKDFETSNWSWDPVAKAYYWHRFFSHQPDLNFLNPEVEKAVLSVCDFWLDLGVDGMRLDAIPYLYEEDGTNCENLPQTHAYLKRLRAHIDAKYKNRMLLAEANQWPEDAAAYFGTGDECNMNFHFPIMPRIFMSIHREDRLPIVDILEQTPAIPSSCQWALFLRNHDELTLEMVTDEERDYMYRAFANDPTMRINLGIRRRLAPLLQNDRPNIELMNALLFSLPGTPVIYYGDELGMGDNVYLGDRNSVRTPMQWNGDRNAGFSRANPQRLMLPVIIDPEYHYESINVEAQQNNPHSLLWWTKRLVALRKRSPVFGRGAIELLQPDNPRVLAFIRTLGAERVLVVANLSRTVQYAELDLAKFKGLLPVEMFGGTKLPPISERPYLLTLSGHAFYWFSLERTDVSAQIARDEAYQPLSLEIDGAAEDLFNPPQRATLAALLPNFLGSRHWFRAKGRSVDSVEIRYLVEAAQGTRVVAANVRFDDGQTDVYMLFLKILTGAAATDLRTRSPAAVVGNLRAAGTPVTDGVLIDISADAASSRDLLSWLSTDHRFPVPGGGAIQVRSSSSWPPEGASLEPQLPRHEHQTTAMLYGDQLMLKLNRLTDDGIPTDLEMTGFLTGRQPPAPIAPLVRSAIYYPRRGEPQAIAALHRYVPHDGNAQQLVTGELSRFFERVLARPGDAPVPPTSASLFADVGSEQPSQPVSETIGVFLQSARLLGQRVAELHLSLGSDSTDPAFAPEPYSALDQRSTYQTLRNLTGSVLRNLKGAIPGLPETPRELGRQLTSQTESLYKTFQPLLGKRLTSLRSRIHTCLDLFHILYNGKDFTIIDFDGNRSRPLSERRRKHSPLFDVATVLTFMHQAVFTTVLQDAVVREPDRQRAQAWASVWLTWIGGALFRRYQEVVADSPLLPRDVSERHLLLHCFLIQNGLAELDTQLERPSGSVEPPLRLLLRLLQPTLAAAPVVAPERPAPDSR